jgi:hypothetical protein
MVTDCLQPLIMLLIDPRQSVASLPAHTPLVPFILQDFGGDVLKVAGFLAGAASLERLVPLLLKELSVSGHPPRHGGALPMLILADAARAIARGSIQVARAVPDTVALIFQESLAAVKRYDEAVRFATARTAANFLTKCLRSPEALPAFVSAFGHPGAYSKPPPTDPEALVTLLADLLARRELALIQMGADERQLRIVWVSRQPPSAVTPPAPPPPPPIFAAVTQIIQAAENALPDLPAEISAQAQTLMDAATDGVPFCEECAKAAMGLLGV